jgi:hypothetical protein
LHKLKYTKSNPLVNCSHVPTRLAALVPAPTGRGSELFRGE